MKVENKKGRRKFFWRLSFLLIFFITVWGQGFSFDFANQKSSGFNIPAYSQKLEDLNKLSLSLVNIFQRLNKSLVAIGISKQLSLEKDCKITRVGTGFVIDNDGHILTNKHVIEEAVFIFVYPEGQVKKNKKGLSAKLIAVDPIRDLALLKIEDHFKEEIKNFKPVVLGDSDKLRIGEIVAAIGNPYNIGLSISFGVISALDCFLGEEVDIFLIPEEFKNNNYIQIDAPVNPGCSGGVLLNLKGEVIGIITFLLAGAQNIAFALPINEAKIVLPRLLRGEDKSDGWIGALIKNSPDNSEGVIIFDIIKDGPSDKAGLQKGDKILIFNKRKVKNAQHLEYLIRNSEPGFSVPIEVIRDKKRLNFQIKIEKELKRELKRKVNFWSIISDILRFLKIKK